MVYGQNIPHDRVVEKVLDIVLVLIIFLISAD